MSASPSDRFPEDRIPARLSPCTIDDARWMARALGRSDVPPLQRQDLELLQATLRRAEYPAGTVLFPANELPSGVWMVRQGAIELVARLGRRHITLRQLSEGECVGDVELLSGQPGPYATRTARNTLCLYADAEAFWRLLSTSQRLALRWSTKFAVQLGRNRLRIIELLAGSLAGRVARLLLDEAKDGSLSFSQSEMAAMLGAHRSPLNQALKALEHEGAIKIAYRSVRIVDRGRLMSLATSAD